MAQSSMSGGGGSGGQAASLNNAGWYLSGNCNGAANCTTIKADGKYVVDATSNSTTTVTCPNSDCNFTSADVGKKVWATTQGSGNGIGYLIYTTYVCPVTTIASVNSAQSITLTIACTASGTANVALYWGTDDGSALAGLDAAVGCSVVHVPANVYIFTSQPFLVNAPSSSLCNQQITLSSGAPAPYLLGDGFGGSQSIFVITPDFAWANCKAISGASQNVCIGGTARGIANIQLWGTGLTSASNSACSGAVNKIMISSSPNSSIMYGVNVGGICPGASGMIGIEINSADGNLDLGGAQEVGTTACNFHAQKGMSSRANDCHNINVTNGVGFNVEAGAQVQDFNSFILACVTVAGNLQSHNTHFTHNSNCPTANGKKASLAISGSGIVTSDGDFFGVDAVGTAGDTGLIINSTTATFSARNSTFTAPAGGNAAIVNAGGAFIDQGGNKVTGTGQVLISFGAPIPSWSGQQVLSGSCTGTATAGSTLGVYGLGTNLATTCTSTTVNLGVPLTRTGTLIGLGAYAGTGGVNASSGVVTVLKNGVATTLTCTLGTGVGCLDNTHTVAYAFGDIISVQFTTQAAETLANVKAIVLAW